jgi:hypothetical protein
VLHRIKNNRNQSKVVPLDIENNAITVHIRVAKRVGHIREILPISAARHLVPFYQRRFGVWMFSPELSKSTLADDSHRRAPITNNPILGSPRQVWQAVLNYEFPMKQ